MTWTTPKTNWDTSPKNPDETDFNRIEGNLDFLKGDIETKKGVIVTALQSIGYSVTMANTHAELAAIISAILEATGDAVVADVAIGKTFSVLGQVGLTGTAKRRATGTAVTQVTDGETSFITVTGLTFKPTIVVTNREGPGNVKAPGMIANGKNYYASQYWDGGKSADLLHLYGNLDHSCRILHLQSGSIGYRNSGYRRRECDMVGI